VEEGYRFHRQQICQEQLFIAAFENSTLQRKRLLPQRVELEIMGGVYRTDAGDYRQAERPRGYDLRRPQNTSTRQLSDALSKIGFRIGRQKVSELLAELGYSLQGNRKQKREVLIQTEINSFVF
jgi:hypothetical protein